jgi:hypothetical protein
MVAEEAPCVFCPDRHRVGVKRSREQPNRLVVATAEVRPALEADPASPVMTPTINTEGTGATPTSTTPESATQLPTRPRSLLTAAVLTAVADDSDPADPLSTEARFTHGLLGRVRTRREPMFCAPDLGVLPIGTLGLLGYHSDDWDTWAA